MVSTATKPEIAIVIQNDSGMVIPSLSVVVCTSVELVSTGPGQETILIHHVTRYSGQAGNIFVTGPSPIPPTSTDTSPFPGSRSLGIAYSDPLIYVSIDQTIQTPLVGEQWGPVPGQWTISRGFMGFYAQGYPAANGDPTKAMFLRGRGWAWGELGSSLAAGSWTLPTSATVIIYNPDPSSMATPKPLIQATPQTGSNQLTVYNYDPSLTGLVGYQCKIEMGDCNGPSFYWVGCAAEST